MYNFNFQSKIPLRLSIAVSACLAPWFDDDVLEKGLALNRDTSIWSRICALFYGLSAGKSPRISNDKESGIFLLDFGSGKTAGLLRIHLPRHRTLEIIEQLGCSESLFSTLPPARQGVEVKMDEEGQITVKQLLWRDNRETLLLSEISGRKFGNTQGSPDGAKKCGAAFSFDYSWHSGRKNS